MIQCQNPVSVGWGNYVIAWLLTYSGSDCRLWSFVYSKCVEAGLCRELAEMLMNELRKHRCFALLDIDDVLCYLKADQTPQPPNQPKHPNHPTAQNHPSSSKHLSPRNKHLLKRSKTKLHNRLDAYALLSLKTTPPFSLSSTPPT